MDRTLKNRSLSICLFLVISLLMLSCDNKEADDVKSYFTISPENLALDFEATGGTNFYTVNSDKTVQVISDKPDWCKAVLTNVSFDNLKIAVSENKEFQERKATVTISNGLEKRTIRITQQGVHPVLTVDKNNVFIQFGKPEFTLDVDANIPFHFELPEWVTEKGGNEWREGKKTYAFMLSELPDELLIREGSIMIKSTNESIQIQPVAISITQKAVTKIIAHRGYWQTPNYPQNSLASFRRAIDLGIYGSEMDVYITTDGVVVLNHDATINGINVEKSIYDDLKNIKLSNGEPITTLRDCIILAKERNTVKLVIEIKPHSTTTNENRAVDAVVQLVEEHGITHLVDYISFSQNICKRLIAKNPKNRVAYLNGNLTPDALYNDRYWGLDYSSSVLKSNTSWVKRAQNLGITTNVWTVNSTEDFEFFISMGVNFITTDYPQNLKQLLTTYK